MSDEKQSPGLRTGEASFNHTRGDGQFNPCPICLPLMSREDLIACVSDMQMSIRDLTDPEPNEFERASETVPNETTGCPCLLTEPCSSSCTCNNAAMSGGCCRCARYGSLDQRKAAAERFQRLRFLRSS